MVSLYDYGLEDFFTRQLKTREIAYLAKVISAYRKGFKVIDNQGVEKNAIIKGSDIHHKILNNSLLPKLGDFVILQDNDHKTYFINRILKRKNILRRKIAGNRQEDQIIATNIDYAFITIPADSQFNVKKLERMIIATEDAKIIPVIVITKTDIPNDLEKLVSQVKNLFEKYTIIQTSLYSSGSTNDIRDILKDNKVGVLIGNSGSGKSTLVNLLLQKEVQKTQDTSKLEDKGKHTTTHRELFLLDSGGCIVDNPGIKEFGLWLDNSQSLEDGFKDITELALLCTFTNCTHTHEKGCAIMQALTENKIDEDRLKNYLKLKQEEKNITIAKNKHNNKQSAKKRSIQYKEIKMIKKFKYNINDE